MTENDERERKARLAQGRFYSSPIPEPQDYPGLNAAGFLLVALGHLVKAIEKLDQEPPSRTRYRTWRRTRFAANYVRQALDLLDEQKEETCEKSEQP